MQRRGPNTPSCDGDKARSATACPLSQARLCWPALRGARPATMHDGEGAASPQQYVVVAPPPLADPVAWYLAGGADFLAIRTIPTSSPNVKFQVYVTSNFFWCGIGRALHLGSQEPC
ncbi:uncharacterized protein [Miscanthus floridulus]|uniref:uncharacterized protein n=1 Tax=Miscanthus floridulus TaxID=154761 RepID=UPI00345A95DC